MALAGMSRAEECQRNADECLQTAQRMSVKHERQRMLDMARHWQELARKAEAEERHADQ